MILVTGGTGFIGRNLIHNLTASGYPVRTLIRPSKDSPKLPKGIPVEVAVSNLLDERGIRAAMVGVDTVFHLAGAEWRGARADLMQTDIQGTRTVTEAAADAGIQRIFLISHLGADRASAYPAFKAKAISEEFIRQSGVNFTIIRTGIVYGPRDGFTTGIYRLLRGFPVFFWMPGDGEVLLQPLWIDDLINCLSWSMDDQGSINKTIEIGGPEYLSFNQIVMLVMMISGVQRKILHVPPPYLRGLTVLLESIFTGLPVSIYWLDYFSANRTCSLDTIPRIFGLLPSRMSKRLDYLKEATP